MDKQDEIEYAPLVIVEDKLAHLPESIQSLVDDIILEGDLDYRNKPFEVIQTLNRALDAWLSDLLIHPEKDSTLYQALLERATVYDVVFNLAMRTAFYDTLGGDAYSIVGFLVKEVKHAD